MELSVPVVRSRLKDAVRGSEFSPIRAELRGLGVNDAALVAMVDAVNERPESQTPLLRMRDQMPGGGLFERYALMVAAADRVAAVPALPLSADITQLLLEEFTTLTVPPLAHELAWFEAGRYVFSGLCKLVTLRRFPAGHFHWEVSGLPRSVFLRVKGLDRARLAGAVARLGGFAPLLVPHMPWRRPLMMLESQQRLSYSRMADAMRRQPAIRGFMAEAWFHAPDIARVSPHLGWMNRVFEEWGGVVVTSGPAGVDSGVFERSAARQRLAAEGKYVPTLGLVIWPRRAMLRWAEQSARAGLQAAG